MLKKQPITLLGFLQRFLGQLAFGDVLHQAQPVLNLIIAVFYGRGPHNSPDKLAVFLKVTLFSAVGIKLALTHGFTEFLCLFAIFRMGNIDKGHLFHFRLAIT